MEVQVSSFDKLLAKRNLKYCWNSSFSNKRNLHSGDFSVYIVLDSWEEQETVLQTPYGVVYTKYSVKYIGKGVWNSIFTNLRRKRCLNHRNDLYADNLKESKDRYLIFFPSTTLDESSAFNLEKALIDAAILNDYTLTSKNARHISTSKTQLWNKCKGHGNNTRTAA